MKLAEKYLHREHKPVAARGPINGISAPEKALTIPTKPERGALRIYSALLDVHLWYVADDRAADVLRTSGGVSDPVYTLAEIRWLRGQSKETLKTVHETKSAFIDAKVVSAKGAA